MASGGRSDVIHALRGVAALWVVLFHLEKTGAFNDVLAFAPKAVIFWLFSYGSAGVAMFFVISGFVIAYSLDGKEMNFREFGKFVARRSLRLDPPYWAAIGLGVGVGLMAGREYSWDQVILHILYLQELTKTPAIQAVFWTLTYEVQFYLVTVLALLLACYQPWARMPIFLGLYVLALASAAITTPWVPNGVFVQFWHGFVAGACAYRCGVGRLNPAYLFLLVGAMAYGQANTVSVFNAPAAVTCIGIFAAARMGLLFRPMPALLMGLGTISYSLYLVHVPVMDVCAAVVRRVHPGALLNLIAMIGTIACCLIAALVLYLAIELPSHRWAKRLFRKTSAGVETTPS